MDRIVEVQIKCMYCKQVFSVIITEKQYQKLVSGKGYIQDILSDQPAAVRELFISQTCDTCFNEIMGGDLSGAHAPLN